MVDPNPYIGTHWKWTRFLSLKAEVTILCLDNAQNQEEEGVYNHGMIGIYFYLRVKMFEVKRTILCLDSAQIEGVYNHGIYFRLWVKFFMGKRTVEEWNTVQMGRVVM